MMLFRRFLLLVIHERYRGNIFFCCLGFLFILYGLNREDCLRTGDAALRSEWDAGVEGADDAHPPNLTCSFGIPGLGNLMFQYASLFGMARSARKRPVVPQDLHLLKYFNLTTTILRRKFDKKSRYQTIVEKKASAFDEVLYDAALTSKHHIELVGYLQSWKYFEGMEDIIRREFGFRQEILHYVNEVMGSLGGGSDTVIVGIHVRRGDLLNSQFSDFGYTVANATYLEHAMTVMEAKHQNIQYLVCSDDIAWAKANIKGSNGRKILFSTNHTAIVDLAFLAHSDHVIMTVGTFGWWGAWLSGGDVIYYKDYPRTNSKLQRNSFSPTKSDYFPPTWMAMS